MKASLVGSMPDIRQAVAVCICARKYFSETSQVKHRIPEQFKPRHVGKGTFLDFP